MVIIPIRFSRWLVFTPIREEVLEREQAFVRARGTVALYMQPLASRVRDHRLPEFRERQFRVQTGQKTRQTGWATPKRDPPSERRLPIEDG